MDDAGTNITGVLLAGGSARRMGGCDKCLLPLRSRPILDHIIAVARPQVSQLLINSNSEWGLFQRYDLPVLRDSIPGRRGPLAGVLAAMQWMDVQPAEAGCGRWLASFPTDSPFFPADLVQRLRKAADSEGADIAYAASRYGRSPLFALWSLDLKDAIEASLVAEDNRVSDFINSHRSVMVDFAADSYDPFFNINTVEDLRSARMIVEEFRPSAF